LWKVEFRPKLFSFISGAITTHKTHIKTHIALRAGVISSSVEYLHFGCNKAEGRGQKAEGRKKFAR